MNVELLQYRQIHHIPPLSIYYWPPAIGNWATQAGFILRDKFEVAPEKPLFQLQAQPWLLHWGSGRENDTFQSIMQLVIHPPLTSTPLLPQPQTQRCCRSPVSHSLRNS